MTWTSAVARARRRARIVFVIILAGSAMSRVAAQVAQAPDPREAKPERPSVATHAYTVAPGILEAEMGIQAQHPTPSSRVVGVPVLLKIGLSRRLQLDISPGVAEERIRWPGECRFDRPGGRREVARG